MVELMLGHAGAEVLQLEANFTALRILRLDRHANGALDGDPDTLQGQTSFLARLDLVAPLHDAGIDQSLRVRLGVRLKDEDPSDNTHLRTGEAGAVGVSHQGRHPLDEAQQIIVEALDLARRHPERRVGVLPDLSKGEPSAGFRLRIQLLVPDLSVLFGHAGSLVRRCRLQALRIDVDDGAQPGLAHGRGGGC
jgi:hypothetical protein